MEEIVIARKVYFASAVDSEKSEFGTGNNYILETYIKGPTDPVSGLVINLIDLDKILKAIVKPLDHKHLNKDFEQFSGKQISPSFLAEYFYKEISARMPELVKINPDVKLVMTRVYEGEDTWADCGSLN